MDYDGTVYGDDVITNTNFRVQRAVVLCRPTGTPAAFLAKFMGPAGDTMDVTGSARISENVLTTSPNQYDDEPVIVYELNADVAKMNLAQELQSTGDDLFLTRSQTGLTPVQGGSQQKGMAGITDTHRLGSVELFLRRGSGVMPGTRAMQISPVTSNILDIQAGTVGTGKAVPGLNATTPVKAPVGGVETGRFFGFRLEGSNVNSVFRYLGGLLRGHRTT